MFFSQQIKMEKDVSLVEHVGHKELNTSFFPESENPWDWYIVLPVYCMPFC